MAELNYFEWESFLARFPDVHILQSAAWGELKAASGWEVHRLQAGDSGAQILFRQMAYGIKFAYIPKGPVGKDWVDLLPEADHLCRKLGARFLKVEPDAWEEDVVEAGRAQSTRGFPKKRARNPASADIGSRPLGERGRYSRQDEAKNALQHPVGDEEGSDR